ncbi:hypothetical protein [Azospirillum argentinense]
MDWTPAKNAAKRRRTGATSQQACSLIVARLGPALHRVSGVGRAERPEGSGPKREYQGYPVGPGSPHGRRKPGVRHPKAHWWE